MSEYEVDDEYERWYLDEVCAPLYKTVSSIMRRYDHILEGGKKGVAYPSMWLTGGTGRNLLTMLDTLAKVDVDLGAKARTEYQALKKKHDLHDDWFKSH